MKKVISIVIVVLYTSLSVIQAVNLHFCHGELESLYFTEERSTCCDLAHFDHTACCKDITIEIDFNPDQLVSYTYIAGIENIPVLMLPFISVQDPLDLEKDYQPSRDLTDGFSPPKIYVVEHSFLFYG